MFDPNLHGGIVGAQIDLEHLRVLLHAERLERFDIVARRHRLATGARHLFARLARQKADKLANALLQQSARLARQLTTGRQRLTHDLFVVRNESRVNATFAFSPRHICKLASSIDASPIMIGVRFVVASGSPGPGSASVIQKHKE